MSREEAIVGNANRIMVAAGKAPQIYSFEDAVKNMLQTDTVLEALEEYLECSIPGACSGARNREERERNLGAVISYLEDTVLHMNLGHISASRILQGSATDICNLIECVGSLISLEWHKSGEDGSTQYVSLRKPPCPHRGKNPLLDDSSVQRPGSSRLFPCGGGPEQVSVGKDSWLPRLPHVLGEPSVQICGMDAQVSRNHLLSMTDCDQTDHLHTLEPEEHWPHALGPHSLENSHSSDASIAPAAVQCMRPTSSPSAHSRNVLCELLQQQQSWENLKEAHEDLNGDDGAVCAGGRHSKRPSTAKHTDSRRHSVPASMFMDKLPCSKPWLPTGKSGVGLVSKTVEPDRDELTPAVAGKIKLKKKKSVHGKCGTAGAPGLGTLGRVTVTQRALNRSDRVMELMIGDLENLKMELRALQTANKENGTSENQAVNTRVLHDSVRKLDFRAHQLDKAQAQLRKSWNAP